MKSIQIGYSEFVKLLTIENPEDIGAGYRLEKSGVFIDLPPNDVGLIPEERTNLTSGHPSGNLEEPALPFPCNLNKLEKFLEENGMYGSVDPFEMAEVIQSKCKVSNNNSDAQDISPKQETTYLNIIGALFYTLSNGIPNPADPDNSIGPVNNFNSEAQLILAIAQHFQGFSGLSKRNLEDKFPKAKASIR